MKILKSITSILFLLIFTASTIAGCGDVAKETVQANYDENAFTTTQINFDGKEFNTTQKNYDGRTFYEIYVRSFNDSNGDGIGDLNGVTEKLDYLENLGIKGIWLMPINESNSTHGYDVVDYYSIENDYGSMEDLQKLIEEAHKRDIKVIMDLVLNHTSSDNKWFINAREGKYSEYRDYYIWTDDMTKINNISPMNTHEWTKNGDKDELYYSIFWSGMPDLNMDNPKVITEVKNIAKFYLDKGIDGFRVDAAKWIFLETDKNVAFWTDFNKYIKSINKDSILVGEVWDSVSNEANYTTSLDSFFEFSMGGYIVNRIKGNSISGFPDDYNKVADLYEKANPKFVMAPFLSNHDQERVIDSFNEDFQMRIAATMYLTLPGTPFLYYGEEIGMSGKKPDEKIREPFIWSSTDTSKNTSWEPITNNVSKIAFDVEKTNKNSLLNFYKDILKARNNCSSLRYGKAKSINTSDKNIMAMERSYEDETSYVLINGNSEAGTAEVPKGKYKVVYSNKDKKGTITSDGNLELDNEEILIIIKE